MEVIAHPSCFDEKVFGEGIHQVRPILLRTWLVFADTGRVTGRVTSRNSWVFLGEIPDAVDFETEKPLAGQG